MNKTLFHPGIKQQRRAGHIGPLGPYADVKNPFSELYELLLLLDVKFSQ